MKVCSVHVLFSDFESQSLKTKKRDPLSKTYQVVSPPSRPVFQMDIIELCWTLERVASHVASLGLSRAVSDSTTFKYSQRRRAWVDDIFLFSSYKRCRSWVENVYVRPRFVGWGLDIKPVNILKLYQYKTGLLNLWAWSWSFLLAQEGVSVRRDHETADRHN